MTTATASAPSERSLDYRAIDYGHRARGLDAAILRIGAALVRWGSARADRAALTHEQQARLIRTDAAVRATRVAADPRLGSR